MSFYNRVFVFVQINWCHYCKNDERTDQSTPVTTTPMPRLLRTDQQKHTILLNNGTNRDWRRDSVRYLLWLASKQVSITIL